MYGIACMLDLRFSDVGVDDGWQACGTGRSLDNHSSFHAADGTPLVNKSKFQDVKAMHHDDDLAAALARC
jgi:hypothetical protein